MRRYAGVIATYGDSVLLVREIHDAGLPLWSVPSGGVEDGESFAEGAARELAEESGLVVSPGDLVEVCRVELRMSDGLASDAVTFAIEVPEPPIALEIDDPDGSILEAAWFPVSDALALVAESSHLSMVEPVVHFLTHRRPSIWRYSDPRRPGIPDLDRPLNRIHAPAAHLGGRGWGRGHRGHRSRS